VRAVVEQVLPVTDFSSAASGARSKLFCCRSRVGKEGMQEEIRGV
jgi:hypothetical protein